LRMPFSTRGQIPFRAGARRKVVESEELRMPVSISGQIPFRAGARRKVVESEEWHVPIRDIEH
jgi:hypothetical protein